MKRDFKKGLKKGNCFVCGIPRHFTKDCRKKETAQCSKGGEKGHLERASVRQRDGGFFVTRRGILVDSGCTDHIVTNIDAFLDCVPIQSVVRNYIGEASRVVGRGCVRISIPSNKGNSNANSKMFCVCWTILQYSYQSQDARSGDIASLCRKYSCMKLQKGTRVKLTPENNLFFLLCSVLEFKMNSNNLKIDSAMKWHRQLGHLNQADVIRKAPETVGELDDVCNVCALAKITKTSVPRVAETQAEEKLEILLTDLMGPFRVESLSGFRFCIVFAVQYTKFVFVDLIKAKSEILASLKKLRQDNAKEFFSEQFTMYCLHAGILEERTKPETPQQNRLAERCNRTLLEMA